MTVDWEGLKALEAKATDAPWNLEHDNTFVAGPEIEKGDWDWIVVAERETRDFYPKHLDDNNRFIVEWRNSFLAILAQHERDQRVIEAAERLYVEALALIESVPECSALAKNMEAALTGFREAKEKS